MFLPGEAAAEIDRPELLHLVDVDLRLEATMYCLQPLVSLEVVVVDELLDLELEQLALADPVLLEALYSSGSFFLSSQPVTIRVSIIERARCGPICAVQRRKSSTKRCNSRRWRASQPPVARRRPVALAVVLVEPIGVLRHQGHELAIGRDMNLAVLDLARQDHQAQPARLRSLRVDEGSARLRDQGESGDTAIEDLSAVGKNSSRASKG